MARRGRPRIDGTEFYERRGIWYATYRDSHSGRRRGRSTGCRERSDAEIEHAKWLLGQCRPEKKAAADTRLAAVLTHYAQHAKSLRSAPEAGRAIERIGGFFGPCMVSDLTPASQRGFVAHLRSGGCSAGYARRIVAVLAAAVHLARADGILADHPHMARPKAGKSRVRWLRPAEARELLSHADSPALRRFLLLGLCTGARAEAIYQLDWARVDLAALRIDFSAPEHEETTKGRTVSRITAPLADELGRVLPSDRIGLVIGVGSVRTAFRTTRKKAGLGSDVTANTLRHTFASWAVQAGVPLIKVAQALGHRSTQMVERHYGHLAPDHLDEAAEAVVREFRSNFAAHPDLRIAK